MQGSGVLIPTKHYFEEFKQYAHSDMDQLFAIFFRENDITDIVFQTFAVEHRSFGQIMSSNLKENGADLHVNQDNKKEYVQ